jgi:transposase
VADENTLDAKTSLILTEIKRQCPEAETASVLAKEFQALVGEKQLSGLDTRLSKVEEIGPAEIKGFARGLVADRAAVEQALSSRWSNGQLEGQINRLKAIKRQMYGRGKLDLLRARVLGAA